ncbi:MAG: hypothetical protein O7B24_03890, partial [Alphaproteobacteria bacterium]|nr:hypothetical protein [Alphaproteobacteria bacterium]
AQGLSFPEIRHRIQALTGEVLRPLLTPEQLEKYDELTGGAVGTRRRVRVWVVGGDGQPEAVPLLVGISDNSHTEVIRVLEGELDEGSELIVGIDLQTQKTASRRFRLGF